MVERTVEHGHAPRLASARRAGQSQTWIVPEAWATASQWSSGESATLQLLVPNSGKRSITCMERASQTASAPSGSEVMKVRLSDENATPKRRMAFGSGGPGP